LKIIKSTVIVVGLIKARCREMNVPEKDEVETETRESRIDCQIKNLKASFNIQNFFSLYTKKKSTSDYKLSEFGFGVSNIGGYAVRHYVWLCIKLIALYVTKYVNRFFYQRAG
jgi:hypothetical protein